MGELVTFIKVIFRFIFPEGDLLSVSKTQKHTDILTVTYIDNLRINNFAPLISQLNNNSESVCSWLLWQMSQNSC